jgi:hypothetical protein
VRLAEHLSDEDVGRALVVVRDVADDLPAGWVLQDGLERLDRREVAAPDDLVRRCRAVGRGGELANLRPLQAQRSPDPLDDLGVPRAVVALPPLVTRGSYDSTAVSLRSLASRPADNIWDHRSAAIFVFVP